MIKLIFPIFVALIGSTLCQDNFGITFEQFSDAATRNEYPAPEQHHYDSFVQHANSIGRVASKEEAAMAMAQFLHESSGFQYTREIMCAETQCPDSYRRNDECEAIAPDQYYFGRGYIQLTWCTNYQAASDAIFGDDTLVRDPDMVGRDNNVAWQTSFWYWSARVHDAPGVQEGQFGATTMAINGGECGGASETPARRFQIYGNVRAAFGLEGPGDPAGC